MAQRSMLDAEVGNIQTGHGFAKGDRHQRSLTHAQSVVGYHNGGRREHRVDDHARRCAQAVQSQSQVIAGGITDRASIEVETAADVDAVCIVVTSLHCVLKDQDRTVATRNQIGEDSVAADAQGHTWHTVDHHRFAGVDRKGQSIAGIVGSTGRHADTADPGHHGIDQYAAGARHSVEAGNDFVANAVTQSVTSILYERPETDAVAVELAVGDHETEHQSTRAAAADILGQGSAAAIERHNDVRHATTGVDDHVLAEVDDEIEVLPRHVGAVGRHADAGDRRHDAVDDDVVLPGDGIHAAGRRQGQEGIGVAGIADAAAIQRQCAGGLEVQVSTDIARLDGVAEGQGVGARTGQVGRAAIDQSGFQQQRGHAASGVDDHGLVEADGDGDEVANLVAAVRIADADVGYHRVDRVDGDGEGIGVGLDTTAAAASQITGGHLNAGRPVVAGRWTEGQAIQGVVDVDQGTGERHGGVASTIASGKAEASNAAQGDQAIGGGEGDLQQATADVHIADADQVAVARVEHQGAVLIQALCA